MEGKANINYAVASSGGGFKGSFVIGVLLYLFNLGIKIQYFAGVSVSALIGAMVAMNKFHVAVSLFEQIEKEGPGIIYRSDLIIFDQGKMRLNKRNAFRILLPKMGLFEKAQFLGRLLSEKGQQRILADLLSRTEGIKALADNTPLLKILLEHVKIKDFTLPFECGSVSLTTGQYVKFSVDKFNSDEQLALAIWSSATMPIVWSPVPSVTLADGTTYTNVVDGGVLKNSPVNDALDFINDRPDGENWKIIVINCGSGYLEEMKGGLNIASIAIRSLYDITLSAMFQTELERFLDANHRVLSNESPQYNRKGKLLRDFDTVVIQPDTNELGDTLDSSAEIMKIRRELGWQAAEKAWSI